MSANVLPKKGQRYKNPALRGIWTVQSCGPAWIVLKSNLPQLKPLTLPTKSFMDAQWVEHA